MYALKKNNESHEIPLSSKTTVHLKPGDVISYRTSGGGGYGDPYKRDSLAVLHDVVQGKISIARARDRYGVEIDVKSKIINKNATEELRDGH